MYEVWKDVVGYEGLYRVSNNGKVKSCDRVVKCQSGKRKIKGKILKLQEDPYGYLVVHLYNGKKRIPKKVHRLVAENFLSNPDKLPTVHHKNENKKDNHVNNLMFCSFQDNSRYSFSKKVMGINKKTNEVIFFSSTKEAQKSGFTSSNISACCNGKIKSHKGYAWKYIDEGEIQFV